jgi:hypothetical protein
LLKGAKTDPTLAEYNFAPACTVASEQGSLQPNSRFSLFLSCATPMQSEKSDNGGAKSFGI